MALLRRSITASDTPAPLSQQQHTNSTRSPSIKSEFEVKNELLDFNLGDEYTPSTELEDAFSVSSLPIDPVAEEEEDIQARIKLVPQAQEQEGEGEEYSHYQPSDDWAKAFSSLQNPDSISSTTSGPEHEGYMPSEGLLEALASLPQGMIDIPPTSTSRSLGSGGGEGGVRVKDEPKDSDDLAFRESFSPRMTPDFSMRY